MYVSCISPEYTVYYLVKIKVRVLYILYENDYEMPQMRSKI